MAAPKLGSSRPSFVKSYSIEHGYKARRRSLIADAEFDRENHEEEQLEHQLIKIDEKVQDESTFTILVTIKDKKSASLLNLINAFNRDGLKVQHIETRPMAPSPTQDPNSDGKFSTSYNKNLRDFLLGLDVFMKVVCTDKLMEDLKRALYQSNSKFRVKTIKVHDPEIEKPSTIIDGENKTDDITWFPMSIWDLDKCHHLHLTYQPDMDSRHPGFSDKAYRARRDHIVKIAFAFRHGDIIPRVEYTDDEVKTWG